MNNTYVITFKDKIKITSLRHCIKNDPLLKFCLQIPSTLWNVADMPSLENMTREQIEKLVKENVALQQAKPTVHQGLRSNSKHEDSIEDFKKRLNTSCPVHGIQDKTSFYDSTSKTGEKSDSSKDKTSLNYVKVDSTPVDKNSDSGKEIPGEIGRIADGSDGKDIAGDKIIGGNATEDKTDVIKVKTDVTKEKTDVPDEVYELKENTKVTAVSDEPSKEHNLKIKMAEESKINTDSKMAAECSDSDTDDELSADKVGAIMSSIAGSGGYMGRPCTCSANNPVAAVRNTTAPNIGEGDVYEVVPGFVPYNLITQHSIPGN